MIEVIDCYEVPDRFLYKCDPAKNTGCKKTLCQSVCFFTTDKRCRSENQKYYVDSLTGQIKPWNH